MKKTSNISTDSKNAIVTTDYSSNSQKTTVTMDYYADQAEPVKLKKPKAPYFTAKRVALIAILTTLGTLTNIISIPLGGGSNFLSFAYIPSILAGMFLGIPGGFLVGGVADIIGCLISPKGSWLPLITLASACLGGIPGIITYFAKKTTPNILNKTLERNMLLWLNLFAVLVVCTAGLNTFALYLAYSKGKTFFAYLGVRLPFQFVTLFANGIVLTAITNIPEVRKQLTINRN